MDAAERKAAAEAAIVAAEVEYAKIVADGGPLAELAEGISEILTARTMTPQVVKLAKLFDVSLAEALDGISRVEAIGAHIATETVEYPNGRVELDVVGNLVAVEFDDRVELS